MSEWWNSIASSALSFADNIIAQAAAAEEALKEEQDKLKQDKGSVSNKNELILPWDTSDDSLSILSDELMQQILSLSQCDKNFIREVPAELNDYINFKLQLFVPQAMRLLAIDHNLANIHAKVSPRMDEEIFWKNYYSRITYLRARIGIDGAEIQSTLGSFPFQEIIYEEGLADEKSAGRCEMESTVYFTSSDKDDTQRGFGGDIATDSSFSSFVDLNGMAISEGEVTDKSDSERRRRREAEEAALEAEVAAELNESLNTKSDRQKDSLRDKDGSEIEFDDDFDDLVDVDGLGGGDGSLFANEDDDAELEAQIARELNLELK